MCMAFLGETSYEGKEEEKIKEEGEEECNWGQLEEREGGLLIKEIHTHTHTQF